MKTSLKKIMGLFLLITLLLSTATQAEAQIRLFNKTKNPAPKAVIKKVYDVTLNKTAGDKFTMPKTALALMSDKSTAQVAVTWKTALNASKEGTFTTTGTVKNYKQTVKLTLNVKRVTTAKTMQEDGYKFYKGLTYKFDKMPRRIIAGSVGAAEILNALGLDVVAVPTTARILPEKYRALPRIGAPMTPDMEIVKSLQPDVVVTDRSLEASLAPRFKNNNINAIYLSMSTYDDIAENVLALGKAFGREEAAGRFVLELKNKEATYNIVNAGKSKPKVMILFGTPESMQLATRESYVGDLVRRLGGINITDNLKVSGAYVPFSMEDVIKSNPDIILRLSHTEPAITKANFDKEFAKNDLWKMTNAVKKDKVFDLDNINFGVVANIRCAEALEILSNMLFK